MIKEEIIEHLKKAIEELTGLEVEPKLEDPIIESHGDYSSNIAMIMFRKLSKEAREWKSPMDIAEKIVKILNTKYKIINTEKIEVVKPGFINFFIIDEYFQNQLPEIIKKGKDYGSSDRGKGKKVLVEFVSANPTGPLHMGNLRGGPIGDVLSNVLSKVGYHVSREFYVNDIGHQVDLMYASLASQIKVKNTSLLEIAKKYNAPWSIHPADSYKGEEYQKLAKKVELILDQNNEEKMVKEFSRKVIEVIVVSMKKDLKDLGINFDNWIYESEIKEKYTGSVIKKLKAVQEKDGALWFAPKDDFLKDRESVLIKLDGSYTYFANDIAYHKNKFDRGFELLIDVWGANHHGHIPRMKAAIAALDFNPEDFRVILYQWVSLIKEGRRISMSKRKGDFITAREVIDEIGKDALRYFLLTNSASSPIDLDLDLAKKRASDNPVFYVQYAHARISNIFAKNEIREFSNPKLSLLTAPEEIALIRHLLKYPALVEEISNRHDVHKLTNFAFTIADLFHRFYECNRVLSENKELTGARLAILKSTEIVLENTLGLLGITAPKRM